MPFHVSHTGLPSFAEPTFEEGGVLSGRDRVCVNEKIRATKDFQGVTGTLTLQNGDAIRSAVINEVKDGKLAFRTVVNP